MFSGDLIPKSLFRDADFYVSRGGFDAAFLSGRIAWNVYFSRACLCVKGLWREPCSRDVSGACLNADLGGIARRKIYVSRGSDNVEIAS